MRHIALLLGLLAISAVVQADPSVRPLPNHPGNIFLQVEEVSVSGGPGPWQLFDFDGKLAKEGTSSDGKAVLGRLPVGYYELKSAGKLITTIGVVHSLEAPTPATSPIGIDVAMAWFYKPEHMDAVASLCRLAGVNWVRDRLAWGEIEPRRGQLAGPTRYDASAKAQSAAGLRVLQVNHSSPGWANRNGKRFPLDLRDAYNFSREIAKRWRGQVLAFEPWNEADIDVFGGHTGAEMASLQKAAYLGLKAGNPDAIACLNVFAMNRPAQLQDLAANEAWPYFETCNLHHYISADKYPAWYASFRNICAGRPLWVTEFSMPVQWSGDSKTQELSDEAQRTQAQRVPIVLATSLHEGPRAAFYFMLPHYVEGKTQFGIIHRDLTPRPAYLAMAAVGRLLADATPIGRVDVPRVHGYAFAARPDGQASDVVVAWAGEGGELELPGKPLAAFDVIGREIAADAKMKLGKDPVYILMDRDASKKLPLQAAPAMPPLREGKPSPIVLQAIHPSNGIDLNHSSFRIDSGKASTIPIFIYNFGERAAKGRLTVSGPAGWKISLPTEVELAAMDRRELALVVTPNGAGAVETVTIRGGFSGQPVLSIRLEPQAAK